MKYDYESVDTKGTKYGYIDNGHNITVYAYSDVVGVSQKDRFLRTILNDIKDLRELKDIKTIRNTIKQRDARYNTKNIRKK